MTTSAKYVHLSITSYQHNITLCHDVPSSLDLFQFILPRHFIISMDIIIVRHIFECTPFIMWPIYMLKVVLKEVNAN